MGKIFILLVFCALAGCASDKVPESSALPWNQPASWEFQRDISTSLQFKKSYRPDDFNKTR
jgi:hypothetical protein